MSVPFGPVAAVQQLAQALVHDITLKSEVLLLHSEQVRDIRAVTTLRAPVRKCVEYERNILISKASANRYDLPTVKALDLLPKRG